MIKLQMCDASAFLNATDINILIQLVRHTPEHVLVSTNKSYYEASLGIIYT
jgi:hypothetical protein